MGCKTVKSWFSDASQILKLNLKHFPKCAALKLLPGCAVKMMSVFLPRQKNSLCSYLGWFCSLGRFKGWNSIC